MIIGEPVTAPIRRLNEDEITEKQEYLPNQFECIACKLKIAGLSRLAVVNLLAVTRRHKSMTQPNIMLPDDKYAGYEDDNNEY